MQSHVYAAGQHGQFTQTFKGGIPPAKKSVTVWRKQWHSENDSGLRREVVLQITKLVQSHNLESKLPAIAHDLEIALYSDADSKEEYTNVNTLERRICSLILRSRNSQKAAQHGVLQGPVFTENALMSAGNMGYSSAGAGRILSNSIGPRVFTGSAPTALAYDMGGNVPIAGYDKSLFTPATVQPPPSGLGGFESGSSMPKAGSRMIPTPGLGTSGEVSSNPMNVFSAVDGCSDKVHQQLLSMGASVTNFQRGGLLRNNAQLTNTGLSNCPQVIRPDQMFMNVSSTLNGSLHNSSLNPGFGQATSHFPPSVDQSLPHQQYGVAGGDIFAAGTDNPNLGNFQNPSMKFYANPCSLASLPENPYSAMLSENFDATLSQHLHAQHLCQSGALPNSPTVSVISQEHQQQGRTLVVSNQPSYKDPETFLSNGAGLLNSSAQRVTVDMLAGQQDQHQRSNQLFYLQQQQQQQQRQSQQPQKYQHQALSFENKEKMRLAMDAGQGSSLQFDRDSLQSHCPQVLSVDQHSEQTCQASSADTGHSEVVSNDDSMAPSHDKDASKWDQSTFVKQRQWLLLMFWHVSRCKNLKQCSVPRCEAGHTYWKHVTTCRKNPCKCTSTKQLLRHHYKCRDAKCAICGPVRSYVSPQAVAARCKLRKGQSKQPASSCIRAAPMNEADSPPVKRVKLEVVIPSAPLVPEQEVQHLVGKGCNLEQACCQDTSREKHSTNQRDIDCVGSLSPKVESPTESSVSAGPQSQGVLDTKSVQVSNLIYLKVEEKSKAPSEGWDAMQTDLQVVSSADTLKPTKKKVSGITYLECLTAQQIRQHISSLRKWIGQSKVKAERNQAMEHNMSTSACSACAVESLHFDPIPVFCTQCGCRIKRNAIFYAAGSGDNSLTFCGPCYSAIRSDIVESDGIKVQKSALEKKRNDEQRVEAWVECDKCKKWQHQICALFNARINKERSEYVCPECCIAELERGEREPRPANSVLGAKDLPRTMLSDFVEERLVHKLEFERAERAKALGRCLDEIPTAEGLVVRVISSVDKKLEVKPRFLEIFQQEDYPKDFMYKSKMLMLFQEIEGVEVCLFGMYVQEFGAEGPQPNRRHVYLSYLDSVKYFRPDVKAVTGEALRTYVYHEILIAYLDYCKRRGFSSCYIWACPPLKGDDYILYCHPEIQKTPKTDKLREWYLSMIAKAKKENIVTANKNLYDHYFTANEECKAKVTAARLPYFDGDYWPGAAEDILQQLQEEEEGVHSARRGKSKKLALKRTTKTSAHADVTGNVSKDLQLMQKLGQSIAAMKDDFIMVHMHHTCSRCRNFITSGLRWFCQLCGDKFQLCGECHDEHKQLCEDEKHPFGKRECHPLIPEKVKDVTSSTLDRDETMECEYFDNRQAFLSLCQGNQYQYDTLRRAKHSSMMILYHLHNPNAPAFVSSCTICHAELEAGQGWKCNICSDYDVCNGCYSDKEVKHPHKLVARTILADQNAANTDDRKQRILQLRMMLAVLVHCAKCNDASCQFAKCKNMKDLFRHGNTCQKRAAGGCPLCKRMWFLLTAHARSCKESICSVPRCRDLRLHFSRAQQQQESRRRAAFNEMIRQRTAEGVGAQ